MIISTKQPLPRPRRATFPMVALATAILLAGSMPVPAIDLDLNRPPDPLLRTDMQPDLQILENRLRRRDYQTLQKLYREDDRKTGATVRQRQILENRLPRRDYQTLQQLYREDDRNAGANVHQRLKVPRFKRNCQVQPFGNNFLVNCR